MSLGDHLEELRARLILAILGIAAGLIVCLFFGRYLLQYIAAPYENAMLQSGMPPELQAIHPAEKFVVYMKTSLLFGFILSCPWVFYQIWKFISAGLYEREKKYVYVVVPVVTALFIAGALFFLKIIAPIVMMFFVNFDPGIDFVTVRFTLQNYINLVLVLTLVFALAFQMPVIIVIAEKIGLVSVETLSRSRKYMLLALFVIAAFATPPDVISQIALAVPLYLLFEVSLIVCRFRAKKRN